MRGKARRILPAGPLAFSVAQLLTLAPALSPSALYWPQIVFTPTGVLMLIGLALACGLLLHAVALLLRLASARHETWGPHVGAGAIALLILLLQGAAAYYTRFGSYPNVVIVRDFLDAPGAFLAYTASDVGLVDTAIVLLATVTAVGLVVRRSADIWKAVRPSWPTVIGCAATGLLALAVVRALPVGTQHTFMVSEHSLPAVKYLMALAGSTGSNRVESFQPIVPTAPSEPDSQALPKARHVLVIMAEALRADHLPAYGYRRDTTPYLTSEQGRWIAFRRAYAHGSRTADSFPVIFNSRYFAAVDRANRGALALWTSLRAVNVRTAFLSAGAIEWGGVMAAIAFKSIDQGVVASDFPVEHRRDVTRLPFDYAVDDALPMNTYRALVGGDFGRGSSFATLHLVGSHYPFHYADGGDMFAPNLRERAGPSGDSATLRLQYYDGEQNVATNRLAEIANSYDNGIRHIDRLVRQAVETLAGLKLLEDSVIIVTSDHGEALGEHRTLFHGTTLYEEQVHVPLLIRVGANLGPVATALADRAEDVAGLVDLMPTVHQLVSGSTSQPETFQGVSWLRKARKPYELLLFRGIGEMAGVVTRDRKYLFDLSGARAEEYDLAADPAERNNLWPEDSGTALRFIERLFLRKAI
jgi:arylsulfatase